MGFRAILRKLEVDREVELAGQFINQDTRPQPDSVRNYGVWSFVGLWMVTGSFNIGGWTTGSSLISLGLNVWQAMIVVIIGHMMNALICVAVGWPGGKYHIGYPILQRSSWGTRGADIIVAFRIVLSWIWISIQLWWGGQLVKTFLGAIWPSFYDLDTPLAGGAMDTGDFAAFVFFAVICAPFLWFRPQSYKPFFISSSFLMSACVLALLGWAVHTAGGAGALAHDASKVSGVEQATGSNLGYAFVYGISSMLGGLSVHLMHQPDYTRLARRPGDQVWGQIFIVPLGTILNALIGILVTSCAAQFWPSKGLLWEPFQLFQQIQSSHGNSSGSRAAVAFASIAFISGQIGITVCANGFSGGIDLAGLCPRYFTIRRGAYLTLAMGFVFNPWSLESGAAVFITVISAFSTFLSPMIGILVVDFFIIKKQKLSLLNLYTKSPDSIYYFYHGYNVRTFACWVLGVLPFLPGFAAKVDGNTHMPAAVKLYKLGYVVGFALGSALYLAVNYVFPTTTPVAEDDEDYFCVHDLDAAVIDLHTPDDALDDEKFPVANVKTVEA